MSKEIIIINGANGGGAAKTVTAGYHKNYAASLLSFGTSGTFIMEREIKQGDVIGSMQANAYHGNIEGVSPTITAACGMGGGQTPMLVEQDPQILSYTRDHDKGQSISYHTKEVANTLHASKFENTEQYVVEPKIIQNPHGFQKGGIHSNSPTITTSAFQDNNFVCETTGWRIRKLTPTECFRLMDVDDTDIAKIQSTGIPKTQQYKLAGNSIVCNVLFHIFRKMFVEKQNENRQLELF